MNIALLLTGFIRQHANCKESVIKHIVEKYNADVYFTTWNKNQSYIHTNLTDVNYMELFNWYDIKGFVALDYDHYINNKNLFEFQNRADDVFLINERAKQHGKVWVERLIDQWYLIKEGFLIIPNIYDVIIRLRLDIRLHSFSILSEQFTTPKANHTNPYNDHIAYGNIESMRKYCYLHDHIKKMYIEDNVDISFAELMLKHYMENRDPKLVTNINPNISYEILK